MEKKRLRQRYRHREAPRIEGFSVKIVAFFTKKLTCWTKQLTCSRIFELFLCFFTFSGCFRKCFPVSQEVVGIKNRPEIEF